MAQSLALKVTDSTNERGFQVVPIQTSVSSRISRMSWGTVCTTMQRTGSDPWTCVLLRLPWDSGKDGFFVASGCREWLLEKRALELGL